MTPTATPLGIPGGSETILVVEDEEFVRNITVKTLEKFGYRVLTATDGADGINTFTSNNGNIDLVLLDLTMPKLSGELVLEDIIRTDPTAKVIICSGHHEHRPDIFKHARGFLAKPYQIADLATTVREVLDT